MDAAQLVVSTTCVLASTPVAVAAVHSWRKFGGVRFVTCPTTAEEVIVKIHATRAIASKLRGGNEVSLRSCSRWPEGQGCSQSCLKQIAASPNGCRGRALPSQQSAAWDSETFVGTTG